MEKHIKVGDFVKVINEFSNASDFTILFKECGPRGVYELDTWAIESFQVCGGKVKTNFKTEGLAKYAYPLSFNSKLIGFVYDKAIKKI